jgi:predicted TIM-barrel fold metal-dependent hydrolase
MVIDFHTHIFPDELAQRAMKVLYEDVGGIYKPTHDGTRAGLLKTMDAGGIDISVNMPVVTKPSQTLSTNKWAASICSDRIISFGGIYPHSESSRKDIDLVVSLGLKGLKFHAEYQDFVLDDPHMLRVYDYALSQGLVIMHHGGFDPAFTDPFRSTPQMFLHVAEEMAGGVIIAAHLGGHDQWDDVENLLVGSSIYLDTSMGFQYYDHTQFLRIVKKHGAEKILFASDSPWSDVAAELQVLRSLALTEAELDLITNANARRILGL